MGCSRCIEIADFSELAILIGEGGIYGINGIFQINGIGIEMGHKLLQKETLSKIPLIP
jgi:hypothetical protein